MSVPGTRDYHQVKPVLKKKMGLWRLFFVQSILRDSHQVESGLSGPPLSPLPPPLSPRNARYPQKCFKYAHWSGEGEILLRNCPSISDQNFEYQACLPIPRDATTPPSFPPEDNIKIHPSRKTRRCDLVPENVETLW